MVSLLRNPSTSGSGAVFFDASVNMDEEERFLPVLSEEGTDFQTLKTVPIVSVPLVLGICLEIIGIVFVCVWPEQQNKCDTYFVYLYLHCAYWLIVMLTDHLVKKKHHSLRVYGYLDFYQSTYQNIRTPLFVTSLWITCYLLLAVILHHTHKSNYEQYCRASEWFTPLNYILLLTTLELMIIVPVYVHYIKKVLRFNHLHPPPDVIREEWISSFNHDSYGEVRSSGTTENLKELLEKQADLIRYLLDYNVTLSHRMMSLAMKRRLLEE